MQRAKAYIIVVMLLVLPAVQAAAEITTDSIALRHNRLYFPVGIEQQVYRHARFAVVDQADTLVAGVIDHAWHGISVSAELDSMTMNQLGARNLRAVLQTATVDSNITVSLGSDNSYLASKLATDTLKVRLIKYDVRETMLQDFARGNIDGIVSFRELDRQCGEVRSEQSPGPCVAVLIPNVGRNANAEGLLTTSLYYRYRDARQFEGDRPVERPRLSPFDQTAYGLEEVRPFPFDNVAGRTLLTGLRHLPPKLRLYAGDKSLNRLALYFADLVSRDRCPIEITPTREDADIYLEFVTRSAALPSATLYELYHRLVRDSVPGLTTGEHLHRIAALFAFVERPAGPDDYYRNLTLAERAMTEELGVFALFQPTVFLTVHQGIQGLSLDHDGRLVAGTLCRVRLPEPAEGTQP